MEINFPENSWLMRLPMVMLTEVLERITAVKMPGISPCCPNIFCDNEISTAF